LVESGRAGATTWILGFWEADEEINLGEKLELFSKEIIGKSGKDHVIPLAPAKKAPTVHFPSRSQSGNIKSSASRRGQKERKKGVGESLGN